MGQACYGENRENNKNYIKSLGKKSPDLGQPFDDENQPDINEVFEEIEKAKQNNDVKTLLKYLLNDRQIEQNVDCNHEWALPPKTIGSLATYYIFQLLFHNQNSQSIEIDQDNLSLLEQEEEYMKFQKNLTHKVQYYQKGLRQIRSYYIGFGSFG